MNQCYIITKTNQPQIKLLLFISSLIFYYGMSYGFLIAPLYWDLLGGHFRVAHVHIITGVIPSNFKYDNLFLSKLTSLHVVGGLYICTKFYQGMSPMSDHVVDFNHVKGWSFLRGLSRCYKPVLNHKKNANQPPIKLLLFAYFYYGMSYCFLIAALYWDLLGGCICGWRSSHDRCHVAMGISRNCLQRI